MMPDETNIDRVRSVEPEPVSDMKTDVDPDALELEPDPGPMPQVRLSFWNCPLGRTLRGANRTGKTIYSIAAAGITALTGWNISPVLQALTSTLTITQTQNITDMHFTWLTVLLLFLIYALGFLTNYGIVKGAVKDIIIDLREGAVQLRKAKSPSSEDGTDLSPHEKELILQRAEAVLTTLYNRVIRKWIAGIFGNTFEKIPTDES